MSYLGKAFFLFSFALFFLVLPQKVLAVSVSISQYPSLITQNPFSITASISGATSGTNYVRIDVYKDVASTPNYFGETYNGTDWYNGSDYHHYLSVPIVNGQWTGTIQGSIGSPSLSEYDGSGTYKIRLRRYTGGGSTTASEADASSVTVQIVIPTPTPIPPTATPTLPSTPTPKSSSTPFPTQKPTPIPTSTHILAIATTPVASSDANSLVEETTLSPTPVQKVAGIQASRIFPIFFALGGVMLIGCGILFVYKWKIPSHETDTTDE